MTLAHGWHRRPLLVAATLAVVVAMGGGLATDIGPWYQALAKPSFQPPDWLFGPAWTLIYALTAVAAARAWTVARAAHASAAPAAGMPTPYTVLAVTLINATLNVAWTALFFTIRRPDWALVEVVALWGSIVAMVIVLGRADRLAGMLLLPYLGWVGFAAVLNFAVVRLNP